jgi:hypothetical protein
LGRFNGPIRIRKIAAASHFYPSTLKKELIIAKTREKRIAQPKLSKLNPGTIKETNQLIKPIITRVKRPKVKIFIGKVKIKRMGLIIVFKIPKTIATTIAVQGSER